MSRVSCVSSQSPTRVVVCMQGKGSKMSLTRAGEFVQFVGQVTCSDGERRIAFYVGH